MEEVVKWINEKGVNYIINFNSGEPITILAGGAKLYSKDEFIFWSAYPEDQHDFHYVKFSQLKKVNGGASFRDQEGRLMRIIILEPELDNELLEIFKRWKQDQDQEFENINRMVNETWRYYNG